MKTRNAVQLKKQGQTLVEYALLLSMSIGVFLLLNRSVLKGIGRVWTQLGKEITAPCPTCTPPPEIR